MTTLPICQRCKTTETKWLTGYRSDETEVCAECREQAAKSTSYVAKGLYCWGRGKDITEAKINCVKASGKRKGSKFRGYIYRIDGDDQPHVDSAGGICFFGKCEQIEEVN